MKKTIITAAVAAMMAVPVLAQVEEPVRINGSLIDWYYYGKDIHSSDIGWFQQSPGGGAWIDSLGVAHSTGAANYGLLSLILSGDSRKPLLPEFLIRNTVLYSNCGGIYMGGNEYYSLFGHEVDASANIDGEYGSEEYEILVRKWTWEGVASDGSYYGVKYENVGKLYNQPTDLAFDPKNDIVYGVFNIGGGNGYKLGILNMKTFDITYISREAMPLTGELRTLACNAQGQLFGTDKSGNIYRVSTTDGKLTKIGDMGFQSQQRMMSATIDYRTGKMYWLGYLNNGKKSADASGTNTTATVSEGGRDTGLYEINTETGEAKLIGKTDFVDVEMEYDDDGQVIGAKTNKYGKFQMTGIYVEGSIVKPQYNLAVSFKSAPEQMTLGQTTPGTVIVNVKNVGTKKVRGKNYSVSLYADDQLIGTIDDSGEDEGTYTDNLEAGDSQDFTFEYKAPDGYSPQTVILRAVVNYEEDEVQDNNVAETSVALLSKVVLPAPVLKGVVVEKAKGTSIELAWNNPKGRYTESAEDFYPFSYDNLGAWIVYDGDKGYTQKANNWNSSIDYPNWGTPKAFIVMNPEKAGFDLAVGGEKFAPHSGEQYFAAWWTAVRDDSESGGHQVPNDDWLISPKIDGSGPQTISFWAKGYKGVEAEGYQTEMNHPELMRVLATKKEYKSAADFNLADWEVITDTFQVSNTEWTEYTVKLSYGYNHFALQCCSQEGFVLMIDDISFTVSTPTLTGFNVYRNGRRIVSTNEFAYTVENAVSPSTYTVRAVYDGKESPNSNAFFYGKEVKGDVNGDYTVDVADIGSVIDVMATGGYVKEADVNGDGAVDVADVGEIIDQMTKK